MHKTIGILGGMSPPSTEMYYNYLWRTYTQRFGNHGYPQVIIFSVTMQDYRDYLEQERWDAIGQGLAKVAQTLEAAGSDFLIIATNTMHLVYDQIQAGVKIPVLSMLDAVAEAIQSRGMSTVGLLGTKFTMEQPLYTKPLGEKGITVLVPDSDDRATVNTVLFSELGTGLIREESRAKFVEIAQALVARGAEGVILGCTEIPLLINEAHVDIPVFDTTRIHAEAALRYALERK